MRLNIDTSGVQFFCTRAPEARTDRDTGVPRMDREAGLQLWQVQLAALDSTGGEVLGVTVAGQPEIAVGSPVVVERLYAIPWSQGDRSGVAYRAASLRSTGTPIAGVINPSSPASERGGSGQSGKQAA
ncbi:MAG: hypothetical protein ACR2LF_07140 [Jatrophihabitantaceae bacterium]